MAALQPLQKSSFVRAKPVGRRHFAPAAIFGLFTKPVGKDTLRQQKKIELLDLIKPLQRGVAAEPEDIDAVEVAAQELEKLNPTPKTLASPLVNGKWELLYTTSQSVNGKGRPAPFRPSGPIYQILDAVNGKARNKESAPFFNQVAADLIPLSSTKVKVKFTQFKLLGFIPVNVPDNGKAVGTLDITYLDDDLRVSRGDKGNLFVLKMVDRDTKP